MGQLPEIYESKRRAEIESFNAGPNSINPNFMTFLFIAVLILSVFAGALVKYAVEKILSKTSHHKCLGGRCGAFGWTLVRKDAESCHAKCVKCGWMSHFDIKQWQRVR
jgi:hypothetical protein